MKSVILVLALTLTFSQVFSQVFSNKEVGKKNQDIIDSLNTKEYPYVLPILGAKATQAGFSLPYSAGISIQYFGQESSLIIDNLFVGFNNGPMYDLDGVIRFEEARARANAITVRPDVWLFPFLNVYAILGTAQANTDVNFGIWIPDSTGTEKLVLTTGTTVDFVTSTFGFGITPTIGVGGGFMALDLNMTWTDVPQLSKPARTFVFGPRFGKNFKFKKPERSIAVWVGGFRVSIQNETNGSINLSEVIPEGGGDAAIKIDEGIQKVGDAQQQVDDWWGNLSQLEQNNPVNKAKYNASNAALDKAGEILNAADGAVSSISTSTVQYSMDKQIKDAWNFIAGSQFQLNKHFMIRGEVGFLGSREQVLVGLQYRFGL